MQEMTFEVPTSDAGQRLDVWLEEQIDTLTRSMIGRLIKEGHGLLDGKTIKPGFKLRGGETVQLVIPEPEQLDIVPEKRDLTIVYEDDDLLLINKPPHMVVHPSPGHPTGTLLSAVLGYLGPQGGEPNLIHRLDEDTSGIIAVAKNAQTHTFCQQAFHDRVVRKRYLALVHGKPRADVWENQKWLKRHEKDFRKRCTCVDDTPGAKSARSTLVVRERHHGHSVLEVRPFTGRTHQVRVHAADSGHAVLADKLYSRHKAYPPEEHATPRMTRQALHAWALALPHPNGQVVVACSSIPADMAPWITDQNLVPMAWPVEAGTASLLDPGEIRV